MIRIIDLINNKQVDQCVRMVIISALFIRSSVYRLIYSLCMPIVLIIIKLFAFAGDGLVEFCYINRFEQ